MKRFSSNLVAAVLAFSIGTLVWWINPWRPSQRSWSEPLQVTITFQTPFHKPDERDSYSVTVTNVSDKTVRGYSLGYTCACRGWDSNDQPYPRNINFTNPSPDRQLLLPGESQTLSFGQVESSGPRVWVDLVHFEHGDNWGPNQGHKEGYVRE